MTNVSMDRIQETDRLEARNPLEQAISPPLITFYGDDFTGSTDVLEVLEMAGISGILFLDPPTTDQLNSVPACEAIGLAGVSRSLKTDEMEAELRPKFQFLQSLGARLMHYKVCSTMDSSPEIGSIGRAIDIGFDVFRPEWSPIVMGAPRLNRFVAFGNLFARVGETTYRLDRHPTMKKHPITPMTESDIRKHIGKQTDKGIGLVDTLQLKDANRGCAIDLEPLLQDHPLVLFDTVHEEELVPVGRLIWESAGREVTFSASSSGLEYALAAYWKEAGLFERREPFHSPEPSESIVVMCGSASPATAGQINDARKRGWGMLRLDTPALVDPNTREEALDKAFEQAMAMIQECKQLVIFSTEGPDDPILSETRRVARESGVELPGQVISQAEGKLLKRILKETGIRRVCVAGGDTSGYCAKALDIFALGVLTPVDPGSPLCRAYADGAFDGLEISLKGGQMGMPDYFFCIQQGNTNHRQ